jgi:hypothetical protein
VGGFTTHFTLSGICRMIVERHGGQLTALSDGKSGALFQFVPPIEFMETAAASA